MASLEDLEVHRLPRLLLLLAYWAGSATASLLMQDVDAPEAFDAAVRVQAGGSQGTGIVFAVQVKGDFIQLSIATAGHVLKEGTFSSIGFRSESDGFSLSGDMVTLRTGGPTKKEDLGFVGMTVDLAKRKDLTDAQKDVVRKVKAVDLAIAPTNPFDFMAHGYGATARPVANQLESLSFNGALYLYPLKGEEVKGKKIDYGYGVERFYKSKMTTFEPFKKDGYEYASMTYGFENKGDGFGLGGDSGSGILYKGQAVGVYTSANTRFYDDAAMDCNPKKAECAYEAIYLGSRGRALAFTEEDVKWLKTAHLPEPSTGMLGLMGLLLILTLRSGRLFR